MMEISKRGDVIMGSDEQLEALLNMRDVPEMPGDLESRILQASASQLHIKRRQFDFLDAINVINKGISSVLDCILLPRPAYAMAVVLIVGAVIGLYSGAGIEDGELVISYANIDVGDDMESFIMASEDFEYGDYL